MGTEAADQKYLLAPARSTQLAYRFVARIRQIAVDRPPSLLGRASIAAGIAVDIRAYWRQPPTDGPAHLPRRVIGAALEQAAWAAQVDGALDTTVLLGLPLSTEVGLRSGPAGLVVPIANLGATRLARSLRGKQTPAFPYLFQVLGAVSGWALARYDERRVGELRALHAASIAADHRRGIIAGAHEIAMGLDSVVDLTTRTAPLLTVPGEAAHLSPISIWKAELAASARGEAAYLSDVLRRWERAHNTASPVLADDVDVRTDDGGRTLVLPQQEDQLLSMLSGLELRGRVSVSVPSHRAHHPGRSLALEITCGGATRVLVLDAADDVGRPLMLNPIPFAPALMVAWLSLHAHRTGEDVPAVWVLPGVAIAGLATIRAIQGTHRGDADTSRDALISCLAAAFVHTALATPHTRNDRNRDGLQPHPFTSAIWAPLFILATQEHALTPVVRRSVWAGLGATVVVGLSRYPRPVRLRDVALALQLSGVAYASVRGWGRALEAHAEAIHVEYRKMLVARREEALANGAHEVRQVVSKAVVALEERLDAVGTMLDPDVREEATIRIHELRRRLDALD